MKVLRKTGSDREAARALFNQTLLAYRERSGNQAIASSIAGMSRAHYEFLTRHRLLQLVDVDLESIHDVNLRQKVQRARNRNARALFDQQQALYQLRRHVGSPSFDVIKGMPLATQYYRRVGDRHCGDIDILCASAEDVLQLESVLAELAYQPGISHQNLGPKPRSAYFLGANPSHWLAPSGQWEIEIHWQKPSRGKFPEFMQQARYWDVVTMPYGSERILRAAPLMLYLIMHGGRSAWRRLKWIVDLQQISNTMSSKDWQEFAELVSQSSWRPAVSLAADVVQYWLPESRLAAELGKNKEPYLNWLYETTLTHQHTNDALEFGFFTSCIHNYFISDSAEYKNSMLRLLAFRPSDVNYPVGPDWLLWPLAVGARPWSFVRRWLHSRESIK